MKVWKTLLAVLLTVCFFIASCSSEPGINKSKFTKLNASAREVRTSISAGASYQKLSELVRQFASEITALKPGVTSKNEEELLNAYSNLLAIYRDGLLLRKYQLDFSVFDFIPKGRIYMGQDVEPIASKYRFSVESHLYALTGQYWKSIEEDSIQIIWSNADSQLKVIQNITNY